MSSSYSPDLRLELIGTGDQAGVWGNTTNNNLGTFIENAVAGYTSVSVIASPQALTAYDGAADEARFAAIALTTTTAANFTVCIPPNSKLYTFYNASAYIATISNSTTKNGITLSGGTTVAIPAGKTMSVWSDGTNVAQQADNFISPALTGTPTAPTAAAGTSTTQIATTAFMATMYPIGSIYSSTVSTNPATLFGFGTWVAYGAGRVLIGDGGGYTAGSTGGSADAIVVAHSHTATSSSSSSFSGSAGNTGYGGYAHTHNINITSGYTSTNHTHAVYVSDPGHYHQFNSNAGADGVVRGLAPGTGYSVAGIGGMVNGGSGAYYTNDSTGNQIIASATTGISASTGNPSADHNHAVIGTSGNGSVDHNHTFTPSGSVSTSTSTSVASSGSSGTGANLQPYVVVYMWNRTA